MRHALAALGLAFATLAAQAAGPQLKGQAPGWYRMQLGSFEVTALSDGTLDLPVDQLLQGAQPGQVARLLQHRYLGTPLETSVNGYLINTGTKLVLIDTGAAGLFGPTLGRLLSNLKASGYSPEQVDEIYITHLHGDHIGGATADGKPVFPNAVVRVDQRDADFWLSEAEMAKAPDSAKGFFQGAMLSAKPYQAAGRFKPFAGSKDGVELVPGVKAFPTYGHTPGHSVYVVQSGTQKMVFWGDLMHVAAVQFADPSITMGFDSDQKAAAPQRQAAYAAAAAEGHYAAATHVAFPGIGKLRADGKGYEWIPVNYSANR